MAAFLKMYEAESPAFKTSVINNDAAIETKDTFAPVDKISRNDHPIGRLLKRASELEF